MVISIACRPCSGLTYKCLLTYVSLGYIIALLGGLVAGRLKIAVRWRESKHVSVPLRKEFIQSGHSVACTCRKRQAAEGSMTVCAHPGSLHLITIHCAFFLASVLAPSRGSICTYVFLFQPQSDACRCKVSPYACCWFPGSGPGGPYHLYAFFPAPRRYCQVNMCPWICGVRLLAIRSKCTIALSHKTMNVT